MLSRAFNETKVELLHGPAGSFSVVTNPDCLHNCKYRLYLQIQNSTLIFLLVLAFQRHVWILFSYADKKTCWEKVEEKKNTIHKIRQNVCCEGKKNFFSSNKNALHFLRCICQCTSVTRRKYLPVFAMRILDWIFLTQDLLLLTRMVPNIWVRNVVVTLIKLKTSEKPNFLKMLNARKKSKDKFV